MSVPKNLYFNNFEGLQAFLLKAGMRHNCFPVNFAKKFSRYFQEHIYVTTAVKAILC